MLRTLIEDPQITGLSISKQCEILGFSRSSYYYKPVPESDLNLKLMRLIDEKYIQAPYYGSRKMTEYLCQKNYQVNRKRVMRLFRKMGIEAMYPKPRYKSSKDHVKYPYLLKNLKIENINQVWGADITYIPMAEGFLYLVAILDLYSRYVVSWRLSNSLESAFCLEALDEALELGHPTIFNTDQGVQFTSHEFVKRLKNKGIKVSMNGKGRCWDNIFVERLWRTIKQEEIYLKHYENHGEVLNNLDAYITHYNNERIHQALNYKTPSMIYNSRI